MIYGCIQVFPYIHRTSQCFKLRLMAPDGFLQRWVHVLHEWRRRSLMPRSAIAPSAVPDNSRHLWGGLLGKYAVRGKRKRLLFHLINHCWNAMLSVMDQVPTGKFSLTKTQSKFAKSTLPSCKAITHAPLGAIAAMIVVQVWDPFSRKPESRRRDPP